MDGALLVRECPDVSPRPLLRNAGLLEPLRPRDNVRSWLFPMTPISSSLYFTCLCVSADPQTQQAVGECYEGAEFMFPGAGAR